MAEAANRATALTTLVVSQITIPVALFTAHADPKKKLVEFDTAGPNGGRLVLRQLPVEKPVEEVAEQDEPVRADPLAVDAPRAEPPPPLDLEPPATQAVAGEYVSKLVEDPGGQVVEPADVRRGVRLEDGSFIDCTEQLAQIDERTKLDKMEVIAFVDGTHVPRVAVKAAYYLGAADEKAPKALRLLFEAMRAERRGAVVKLTKRSRQSLGFIAPSGRELVLLEMVWSEDFREPPARATSIRQAIVHDTEVQAARELIRAMSDSPAVISDLRDDAIALREELYDRAIAGDVEQMEMPAPVPTADDQILEQLRQSLELVAS